MTVHSLVLHVFAGGAGHQAEVGAAGGSRPAAGDRPAAGTETEARPEARETDERDRDRWLLYRQGAQSAGNTTRPGDSQLATCCW